MKKIVAVVTFLSLKSLAFAQPSSGASWGLPGTDPLVSKARQEFLLARNPVLADLRLGSAWTCVTYYSLKDESQIDGPEPMLKFSEFNGFLRNEIDNTAVTNFVFQGGRLIGRRDDSDKITYHVRVAADGGLLLEAVAMKEDLGPETVAPVSLAESSKITGAYFVCPVDKIQ